MTDPGEFLNAPGFGLDWRKTLELGYTLPEAGADGTCNEKDGLRCFQCGKTVEKVLNCAKCRVAAYCSKDCQVTHWKQKKHKLGCRSLKRLGPEGNLSLESDKEQARNELFGRIRFYACPYSVHKLQQLGKGFLFLQSQHSLVQMSLAIPEDHRGHDLNGGRQGPRGFLLHYLTMGEYDSELCREDFELATVRSSLQEAIDKCNEQTHLVVMMRFRCGHVAVGVTPLVPDYALCRALAAQYYAEHDPPALQLQIDDDEL